MTFVWITSYLFVFFLGAVLGPTACYFYFEHLDKKSKRDAEAAAGRTLQDLLEPYTVKDPFLN